MTTIGEAVEVRRAAKLVVTRENEQGETEYLFVAGKSKRLNLLGGGIDEGESISEARSRETCEEIGAMACDALVITDPNIGMVLGEITDNKLALWEVGMAQLPRDIELTGEVVANWMTLEQLANYDGPISALAMRALTLTGVDITRQPITGHAIAMRNDGLDADNLSLAA